VQREDELVDDSGGASQDAPDARPQLDAGLDSVELPAAEAVR
jgi:hypothetical protein